MPIDRNTRTSAAFKEGEVRSPGPRHGVGASGRARKTHGGKMPPPVTPSTTGGLAPRDPRQWGVIREFLEMDDRPPELIPFIEAILDKDSNGKREKWLVGHEDWLEEIPLDASYDHLTPKEQHVIRVYWILELLDVYGVISAVHHKIVDHYRSGLQARSMAHVLYWVAVATPDLGPVRGVRKFLEWCLEKKPGFNWRWTTLSILVEDWAAGRRVGRARRLKVSMEREAYWAERKALEMERKASKMERSTGPMERKEKRVGRSPVWPEPTESEPEYDQLEEWSDDGVAEATDGCPIEPDGVCQHGHPSWILKLGLI